MDTLTKFDSSMESLDPMREMHADDIFKAAFGEGVAHGQTIFDPHMAKTFNPSSMKLDKSVRPEVQIGKKLIKSLMEKKATLEKAGASIDAGLTGGIGTGGAGTAGSALIPVWVDTEIVDRDMYETPLRTMIRRIAMRGKTYDYNALTAKGGASWKVEDASLGEDIDTYDRISLTVKYGYSIGRITNQAVAAMNGYVDATALDLRAKTQALFELEEDTIINGDATTYPTEFDGLIQTITTNTTNLSNTKPSLSDIRGELATTYQAKGRTDLVVTDVNTHNYVKGLLMDFQRQPAAPAEGLSFGIPGAFNFDGANFIRDQFMPQTSGSRRMLFLDTRHLCMAVLLDITYQELPSLNDSRKYMLKVYEVFANKFESAMSQLYGIQ